MSNFVELVQAAVSAIGDTPETYLILHFADGRGPGGINVMWQEDVLVIGPKNRTHPDFIDIENRQIHLHGDGERFDSRSFDDFKAVGVEAIFNGQLNWPINPKCKKYTIQQVIK